MCVAVFCTDNARNNDETDVDCGGKQCAKCADAKGCQEAADCASGVCDPQKKTCSVASCSDQVRNGDETDVDCGGPTCPKCPLGASCGTAVDCQSGTCCGKACVGPFAGIAAGGNHTCAYRQDGTLWCWGYNQMGQLGQGPTAVVDGGGVNQSSPVQATPLGATVVEVAAGSLHTCARKQDATLWCWGDNIAGQLGNGTLGWPPTFDLVQVAPLGTSVVEVAAGANHTCARTQDGKLWCWGDNGAGQVGDGTISVGDAASAVKASPVQVASLGTGAVQVAAGNVHTCARKQGGTLWCWGHNEYGQLGDGTTGGVACSGSVCKPVPVQVTGLGASVVEVSTGDGHTCARKQDGTLWCWGRNTYGALGTGMTGWKEPSPLKVASLGTDVVAVTAWGDHTCARKQDGTLWCWGKNTSGQVGEGTTASPKPLPVQVTALGASVLEVSAGREHTCARRQDGTIWCWGANYLGQLGDGTTTGKPTPVQVLACP
jgi:alpha-tubulin suppressor-like RCC1 family protein